MVYSRLSRRLRETRPRLVRRLPAVAGAGQRRRRRSGMAGVHQLPDHQPDLVLPRGASLPDAGRRADTARRAAAALRIWCNAASTGEEPYSLAMTVVETLGAGAGVQILCSDIDTKVLATAAARRLPGRRARPEPGAAAAPLPARHRRQQRSRSASSPSCARLVEFRSFNLMDARWALGEPFDIVFCRNVMIYFDARHAARACSSACTRAMKPRGAAVRRATRRTSPSRATCSACAARRSTSASEDAARPPCRSPRTDDSGHRTPSGAAQGPPAQARRGLVLLVRAALHQRGRQGAAGRVLRLPTKTC